MSSDELRHLRIGMVGGIFDFPADYRARVRWTPETVLAEGLRARGHDVVTIGHSDRLDLVSFDIVHVHHLSWGALRAATDRSRTPFVFTLHGSTPEHARAASFVMRRADRIVALSYSEAAAIRGRKVNWADAEVIPNGIDPTVFSFRQPEPPDGSPWRILFVGQLKHTKGVDYLLDAMADLRHRHSVRLELRYHHAADEDALRARTRELQLDDIVWFAGFANQDQLQERYWMAHIVVLPSPTEALPSVLTEAMLTGSCPVATDVGGVREQLGEFGVLIPRASAQDVIAGVERAIATYDSHVLEARRMREYAESKFSIEGMVSSHEDLYRRLCAGSGKPRRLRGRLSVGTALAGPPLATWIGFKRPLNQVRTGT